MFVSILYALPTTAEIAPYFPEAISFNEANLDLEW
jgi:hypothetical protein